MLMLREPAARMYSAFYYYGCAHGLYQAHGISAAGFHTFALVWVACSSCLTPAITQARRSKQTWLLASAASSHAAVSRAR